MMFTIRSFRAFAVILTVSSCFAIAQNVYGEALGKAASKSLPQRAMERLPAGSVKPEGWLKMSAVAGVCGEYCDVRTRTYVDPVRIVSAGVISADDAQHLCAKHFGQVPEGRFLNGSGPVLGGGAWVILDFGREIHGSLQIGSGGRSGRGAKVHVRFGESVSETMANLRGSSANATATNDHAIRDDVVSLPWLGRREIGETGFRFVRIQNAGRDPVQLEYIRAVSVMRPMKRIGEFKCSDERLNKVWDVAVQTVHLCCQDFVWDGIKRDRLVWMGDTHPETKAILAVFGADPIIPDTLDYAAATTPADSAWMNNMPTYTLWWVRNVAEWYRYTGDVAYLEKHRAYLEKTFNRILGSIGENGMWRADTFLDWPTRADKRAEVAGTQGLLLITLDEMLFLSDVMKLEKMPIVEKRALVAATKPETRGVKTAAAMLSLAGIYDAREMFAKCLGVNGHQGVSTFYGYYMLEAMGKAGETVRALDTVRDYWGGMLDMGATSFWEDFNLAWTNNAFRIDEMPVAGKKDVHGDFGAYCYIGFRHSLCHGWSAGPAAWLINHVLGIRVLDAGCKTIEISPCLGDLEWAEGAMALPNGLKVEVRVERTPSGEPKVTYKAPDGVKVILR